MVRKPVPQRGANAAFWQALTGAPASGGTALRLHLYRQLAEAIEQGRLAAGTPMPATREMAALLAVSRNTVIHAYGLLVAEGYLLPGRRARHRVTGRDRAPVSPPAAPAAGEGAVPLRWQERMIGSVAGLPRLTKSPRWRQCRYAFVYGQHDPATFPLARWREVERRASRQPALRDWAGDPYDQDNPVLVRQICQKLLPQRGIVAAPDEILITGGTQNAFSMIAQLLVAPGFTCAFEEPGHPDMRAVLRLHTANIQELAVDQEGLRVGDLAPGVSLLYCMPGLQYPTMVALSPSRRAQLYRYARQNGTIIVEDDVDAETLDGPEVPPSLKAQDPDGRVIYIGSFAKTLAPGMRIGFLMASSALIHELRLIRRLVLRSPPTNSQRVLGDFLELGYYESLARRTRRIYRQRRQALRQAVAEHLPALTLSATAGGSAGWLPLARRVDLDVLQAALEARSVFVERGDDMFHHRPTSSFLRLGFSSLAEALIPPGIAILAEVLAASR